MWFVRRLRQFKTKGGSELLADLSKDKPLVIILNSYDENVGKLLSRIVMIDLSTVKEKGFYNLASENVDLVNYSLERILTHEMQHAIKGLTHNNNQTTIATDKIMLEINGTRREQYSNSCPKVTDTGCLWEN